MLNKTLFLEIDKPNYVPIYTVQYDYNSRFYEITILNNSQPLDLTGIRVIVAGKKPDGKEVFNSCKVLDAKKGLIQLELTEQMNAVNGASEYALELFSADGMLSSQPFKLIVTRSTISKSVESSKELGALKDALNEVQDIDNRFAQTNAQLLGKANKSEVFSMANMGQDIKEAMTGGSVAIVGANTILTENIVDEQITADKTTFLKLGLNVFNKETDVLYDEKMISGTLGDIVDFPNGCVIKKRIKPNSIITSYFYPSKYSTNGAIYLYNSRNEFIKKLSPSYNNQVGTCEIPNDSNICYMLMNVWKPNLYNHMIVYGNNYPEKFIGYSEVLSENILLSDETTKKIKVTNEMINDKVVTIDKVDFVSESSNKFNRFDVDNLINKYITSSGILDLVGNNAISHFIKVNKNDICRFTSGYSRLGSNSVIVNLYDENKEYISQILGTNDSDNKVVTAEIPNLDTIKFCRFNYLPNQTTVFVVNEEYDINKDDFGIKKLHESFVLNNTQKEEVKQLAHQYDNKLSGKTIVFDGDSICAGNAGDDTGNGWAGRIGSKNNMTWKNYGVSGGTITSGTVTSGGENRHWINENIDIIYSQFPNADYIILEGGTNDADLLSDEKFGVVSEGYTEKFDNTTFIGALETLFSKTLNYYCGKKIGFIIAHKMGRMSNNGWDESNRRKYFDAIELVCKKWGIPYIDLWYNTYLCQDIPTVKDKMYIDGQHLSSAGYDYISEVIESWIERL